MTTRWGWWRSLRDPGRRIGTRLTLFVLLLGLGTSGFLLYQTFAAQRSQREAVIRGLDNVSVLVIERMTVSLFGDWLTALARAVRPIPAWLEDGGHDPPPHPSTFSSGDLIGGNCECPLAPLGAVAFRLELASGELVYGDGVGWDTPETGLRRQLRAAAQVPVTDSTFLRVFPGAANSLILVKEAGEFFAVPFLFLLGPDDRPRWAYGFVVPAEGYLSGSLDALLELAPRLLPRGFRAPPGTPVLASAAITTAEEGRALARVESPLAPEATAGPLTTVAGFRQGDVLDQVRMTAALHPDFLEGLPVSRPTDDRTRPYALLFLLNAGLVGAALLQLTREGTFLRRRSEFVAGFSHEARNPLATIRLYVQALRFDRISGEDARNRALDIIDRESRRLVHMVSNFLSYGAHEGGRLTVESHMVEVVDELRTFAAATRSELRERNAELVLETKGPTWLRTDPTALQEVLRNLVGNALKYGPPHQSIRLGVERVDGEVRLHVEDEGPGVPEPERESIFEPFVRSPAAVRSGAGGSGLGLSVVRELLALQGGRVHVEPGRRGQGARFVVHLPAGVGEEGSAEGRSGPSS